MSKSGKPATKADQGGQRVPKSTGPAASDAKPTPRSTSPAKPGEEKKPRK